MGGVKSRIIGHEKLLEDTVADGGDIAAAAVIEVHSEGSVCGEEAEDIAESNVEVIEVDSEGSVCGVYEAEKEANNVAELERGSVCAADKVEWVENADKTQHELEDQLQVIKQAFHLMMQRVGDHNKHGLTSLFKQGFPTAMESVQMPAVGVFYLGTK